MARNNFARYPDFADAIDAHPDWPRAMCFGDSWFQYPGPKSIDIEKQLPQIFKHSLFFNEGVAGRDSKMYKAGRDRVTRQLARFQFTALLLSMGGNDIVGREMLEFVKKKEDPRPLGTRIWGAVPQEVQDFIRLTAFEAALNDLRDDYVEMFERRRDAQPNCEIFVHNYDYIWPNGEAFKLGPVKAGPWVKPYLDGVGLTDPTGQRVVTSWLIDQLTSLLNELASIYPRVRVIDGRGTLLLASEWDNEIHPKGAGFKKLAEERWAPVLDGVLAR